MPLPPKKEEIKKKKERKREKEKEKEKTLPKSKLKIYLLISLTKKIFKQPSIDNVAWLLMSTCIQIYNEKKSAYQGKNNLKKEDASGKG